MTKQNNERSSDEASQTAREGEPEPIAGVAQGATTLVEVLEHFEANGYPSTFAAAQNSAIRCGTCDQEHPASQGDVREIRRLEGASDPSDMLLVAALRCPHCHAHGALILGYGPDSSPADSDVLLAFPDQHPRDHIE